MDINKAKEIIDILDNTNEPSNSNNNINNTSSDNTNNTCNNTQDNTPNNNTNKPVNNHKCNIQNLIPFGSDKDTRTEEEVRESNRRGGIKSGETRRKRRTAQELLSKILATNMSQDQIEEILGNADSLLNGDKSAYNVMLVKMTQQAMAGDTKAFIALRDTAGDKPIDTQVTINDTMTEQDRKEINAMRKQLMDISKIG